MIVGFAYKSADKPAQGFAFDNEMCRML